MGNVLGDPFALATISIAIVRQFRTCREFRDVLTWLAGRVVPHIYRVNRRESPRRCLG